MPHIIVVDDDPTSVGLLKMLLELDGFTVDACLNMEDAYAAANPTIDAFVIDCHLARGKSGQELLNAIRQNNTNARPDAIVIMTSGDYRLETATLNAGADQFLLKPYPPETLSKQLELLLKPKS